MKTKYTLLSEMMDHVNVKDEVNRLVKHWKSRAKDMTKAQLADAIGDDLEALEYSPEEVEKILPMVLKQVGGV